MPGEANHFMRWRKIFSARKALLWRIAACLLIAACAQAADTPGPQPPIRIGATASALPFVRAATDRSLTGSIPFQIEIIASYSELLDRAAQGGLIGITMYLPEGSTLWATPLGEERIAVVVNPASAVPDLTLAQVRDIFTGRAPEWGVAVREDGDDSRAAFEALALRGVKPALTALVMPTPEAMRKFVAETPTGIGYLPLRWVDNTVSAAAIDGKPPTADDYALKTLIVAVAKTEPTGAAREWLAAIQK